MKQIYRLLGILMLAVCAVGFTSCGSDEPEPAPGPEQNPDVVYITNGSSYTLNDFVVYFTNSKGELITRENKGTLKAGGHTDADIPQGAEYYYMATTLMGSRFFSPDYKVSLTSITLTDATVGEWRTN